MLEEDDTLIIQLDDYTDLASTTNGVTDFCGTFSYSLLDRNLEQVEDGAISVQVDSTLGPQIVIQTDSVSDLTSGPVQYYLKVQLDDYVDVAGGGEGRNYLYEPFTVDI